ncbi:MAG: hypothetical protein ACRDYY_10060 [Acidimicrobiales bacterium]
MTVLSAWESQADLEASESSADKARGDAIRLLGGQATVHRYEQAIGEVAEIPAGAKLHIRHFKIDPSRTDDNLAFFRRNVLPEIKAAPGFLALRQLIDRSTGEGRVGTVWADYEALEASLARSEQRRADATSRGVEFGEERVLEVLFTT